MAQGHIQESCLTRTAANSTASLNCAPARKHYRIHRDRLIKAVDESSCLDASKPAASSHPACFCAHAGDMIVSKRSPAASPAGASAAAAPSCCGHAACAFERWRLWSPSGRPEGKPGGGGGGHQGVVFYEELARVGGVPAAADTPRGSPREGMPCPHASNPCCRAAQLRPALLCVSTPRGLARGQPSRYAAADGRRYRKSIIPVIAVQCQNHAYCAGVLQAS